MTLGQILNREQHAGNGTLQDPASEVGDIGESNGARRKRQRTSHASSIEVGNASQDEHADLALEQSSVMEQASGSQNKNEEQVTHDGYTLNGQAQSIEATALPRTPPKKMLKLNASGKFSSPISRSTKVEDNGEAAEQPKRRGRPRKIKEAKQLVVCILYSSAQSDQGEASIGHKIDQILAGDLTVDPSHKQPMPKKPRTPRKPAKATHPFFIDKPNVAKPPKQDSPRKTAAITPGKLRSQAQHERGAAFDDAVPVVDSALLKDRLMVRHPGAKNPLWPARGMAHVRGEIQSISISSSLRRRKQKHKVPTTDDPLLAQYARQLEPEPESKIRDDGFREPRPDLRIPQKLLISGAEIASIIVKELQAPLAYGPLDELALEASQPIHAAVEHVYHSIPSYLTAFDNLQGEQHGWAQKYAPDRGEHVLQPPREMQLLKTWLQSLAVNTVDIAKPDLLKDSGARRKKKRKSRHSELDDFIVDEADDIRSLDNFSDNENSAGSQSVVQSQVDGVRASNAVLISGPHGCGKTAAIYAVAKELQYRVFEISSSERRSGKDVLDKIGNVTENHIVKRHHAEGEPELSGAEEKERIDKAFKEDLESGRQGKMNAFFKPKAAAPKAKPAKVVKSKVMENVKSVVKKATKDQQQSLILLEEVDILFREDKEFWTTILKLILTSKRPFVMTCNDEDLVPMQAIALHAVLRLTPPESNTAIDYLLLVAAREGHLLERSAVTALWQTSGHDLRRALTTLDFWCRMGVGDVRDGLSWMYQRWPKGSDVDAKGRQLRVVSKGTFLHDMGCVDTREPVTAPPPSNELPLRDAHAALRAFSSIDMLTKRRETDPTLPLLPEKRRVHFIEGLTLLDSQELVDYTGLHSEILDAAESLARKLYPPWHESDQDLYYLSRKAFTTLDTLAGAVTPSGIEASVLDGPFQPIVTEVAPYVRQVVRYEQMLQQQRNAIAGPVKRARTTRAARSALEGGQRRLTRRDHWWEVGDLSAVLATAGNGWVRDERNSPLLSVDGSAELDE